MQFVRKHLTYANVMATVLMFIVLGGTAWALAKNSVGSKQLKKNAVTTKKIKNGSVTGAKIASGAVTGSDIKPTSFNVTVHQTAGAPIPGGGSNVGGATSTCPAGKKAIAGGGLSDPSNNGGFIEDSRPVTQASGGTGIPAQDGTFTGWRVVWLNASGAALNPVVYVVCLG